MEAVARCMYLAQRCTNMRTLKPTHAVFITHGLHLNNYAVSKLLAFCSHSDSGSLRYASLLFHQVPAPNAYMYNTLIRAHASSSDPHLSMHYFRLMLKDIDLETDKFTFHFAILGCVSCCWIGMGRQMHCFVVKNGLVAADAHVQTAILRLYVECGVLGDAHKMFDEIPERDMIRWNVIMNGYVKHGLASEGLTVFQDMLVRGIEPDGFCVATGIAACEHLGALWRGNWVHEFVKKKEGLKLDVFIGTALVDMYAKCGCIDLAVEVFEAVAEPPQDQFSRLSLSRAPILSYEMRISSRRSHSRSNYRLKASQFENKQ